MNSNDIANILNQGGIVVLRTDTIYGILARANDHAAVEHIYTLKGRQAHKPFIQLITKPEQAFGNADLLVKYAAQYRDRPTSIIVEAPSAPKYLVRSGTSIGYRFERKGLLHDIIKQTGSLVAPSANPEGLPPARTIAEAKAYFGSGIDLYVDGGEVPAAVAPSRVIKIHPDGSITVLRD